MAFHACFGIQIKFLDLESQIENGECGIRDENGSIIEPVNHRVLTPTETIEPHHTSSGKTRKPLFK